MIDEAVDIAKTVHGKSKKLKEFKEMLETDQAVIEQCAEIKSRVNQFASQFPIPGHEDH